MIWLRSMNTIPPPELKVTDTREMKALLVEIVVLFQLAGYSGFAKGQVLWSILSFPSPNPSHTSQSWAWDAVTPSGCTLLRTDLDAFHVPWVVASLSAGPPLWRSSTSSVWHSECRKTPIINTKEAQAPIPFHSVNTFIHAWRRHLGLLITLALVVLCNV